IHLVVSVISSGILNHLKYLEEIAQKLSHKQQKSMQQQSRLLKQKEDIVKLRSYRDHLRSKLAQRQITEASININQEGNPEQDPVSDSEISAQWNKVSELQYMCSIYQMTGGWSVEESKLKKSLHCSLITAYEGEFLETYYMDISISQPVTIQRHNFPSCIQLEPLEKQHLQSNIQMFFYLIRKHLNAYEGRKYQVQQIQEQFMDTVAVVKNSLYSVISLSYSFLCEAVVHPFVVTLEYADIESCLPTSVHVDRTDTDSTPVEKEKSEHHSLFLQLPAHKVLQSVKAGIVKSNSALSDQK
ncbi:CENPO protein, partial [Polypterus senegalus]